MDIRIPAPTLPRLLRGAAGALAVSLSLPIGPGLQRPAQSAPIAAPYRRDRVLVAFHPSAPLATRLGALSRLGLRVSPKKTSPHFAVLYLPPAAAASADPVPAVLAELRRDPAVRVAEPDYALRAEQLPNDPRFGSLWGLHNLGQTGGTADADIDAPEAWGTTTGSADVVVAVIDTGVDYEHPDLRDNILRDASGRVVGYDFANGDDDPMDDNGHGTHCAGTIGARGDNGVGVVGVSPNVKLMPLKFLGADGGGWTSDAIGCVDFARQNGARIMSNSWGGGGYSRLLLEAIQRANSAGILFAAAAGNEEEDNDQVPHYPSSYQVPNVVSVAATDDRDRLASFSNYGSRNVHLAAPGVDILSTLPGGAYGSYSGTSMATPHVSGAAALVLAANPALGVTGLKARLLDGVDRVPSLQGKVLTGRLNAAAAVEGGTAPPPPAEGDDFEPDDEPVAASVISSGRSQGHSLHVAEDVDWAKFTLSGPSDVVLETGGTAGDTVLSLYSASDSARPLATDDDGGTGNFSRISVRGLAAGTYLVRVAAFDQEVPIGAYTLSLAVQAAATPPDAYEADNTPAQAQVTRLGAGQSRSIHSRGDVDWVKFTLRTRMRVVIQTSGTAGDTLLRLYGPSSSGRLLASDDNSGSGSFSRIVTRRLAPGTYFLCVEEAGNDAVIGGYRLSVARVKR